MSDRQSTKLLRACLALLGVATLLLTAGVFFVRVKKPIFLPNYCQYDWMGRPGSLEKGFNIRYLANAEDARRVTGIEVPGIDPSWIFFSATESANMGYDMTAMLTGQIYTDHQMGIYALHSVWVTAQCQLPPEQIDQANIVLQTATMRFDDGTKQEVDLGEIRLTWGRGDDWQMMTSYESISTTDGIFEHKSKAAEHMTVVGLHWMPAVAAQGLFSVSVNGVDVTNSVVEGMEISRGEIITTRVEFTDPDGLNYQFTAHDLWMILIVRDEDGVQKEIIVGIPHHEPQASDMWTAMRYVWCAQKGGA